jgi:UvrD-like helicase C-terminal domain
MWPADDASRAILSRTNRELLVAVIAAVELRVPFRAPDLALPIDDPRIDELLDAAEARWDAAGQPEHLPLLPLLGAVRAAAQAELQRAGGPAEPDPADGPTLPDLATALLGWAAPLPDLPALREAIAGRRSLLAELRRDDASLTLATAHGTKGLEWDHVVVLADGFPGRRSISDATEPERALEEERRLAYVAWTRARRSLTLLFDPEAPSPFLLEAFDPDELGVASAAA